MTDICARYYLCLLGGFVLEGEAGFPFVEEAGLVLAGGGVRPQRGMIATARTSATAAEAISKCLRARPRSSDGLDRGVKCFLAIVAAGAA